MRGALLSIAALLAASASAQHISLYNHSFLFSASGDVYFVGSNDKIIYSAFQVSVLRESDRAKITPASGVWPLDHDVAIAQPNYGGTHYHVRTFKGNKLLYSGPEIPFAVSRDGRTVITSRDRVNVSLHRGGTSQKLHLPGHLLGATVSPDGALGVITLKNGKALALCIDSNGATHLRPISVRFASPLFGPDWHGETVAIFGSDTNRADGLGSIWLCNARTGKAENLHASTVAATATRSGFLALDSRGNLELLDDMGRTLQRYGSFPELRGFRYDRGPIAYDGVKADLAGGAPTSLAFNSMFVIARDQFGHTKKASAPWRKSASSYAKLVESY